MTEKITIHQLLHGYENGHKLLKFSINLPVAVRTKLLRLTDYSGDGLVSGFESYITAYPLVGYDYYIFTKTWYAFSKPRPGCVWSHSLLIKLKDIEKIRDLNVIVNLFKEPIDDDFSSFTEPLQVPIYYREYLIRQDIYNKDQFLTVLFLFLFGSEKEIFIPQNNSTELEDILFRIWEYIWPSFKSNFRFCTGSIETRSTKDDSFDVQIIPFSGINNVKRLTNQIIIYEDEYDLNQFEPEVVSISKEILSDFFEGHSLKNFLKYVTRDIPDGRKYFSSLVKINMIYAGLSNRNKNSIKDLIRLIAETFPSNIQATSLKQYLLCFHPDTQYNYGESDFFITILDNDNSSAFNPEEINFRERTIRFFSVHKDLAIKYFENLLTSPNDDLLQTSFIRTILELIDVVDLNEIINKDEKKLFYSISANPVIFKNYLFDFSALDRKLQIINALAKMDSLDKIFLEMIIRKNLDGKLEFSIINELVVCSGELFLDVLNSILSQDINDSYYFTNNYYLLKQIIQSKSDYLIDYIVQKNDIKAILHILPLININQRNIDRIGKSSLEEGFINFSKSFNSINSFNRKQLNIFYFTTGLFLIKEFNLSINFISFSFPYIYSYAFSDEFSFQDWRIIEPFIPSLGFWEDWDKCKRLKKTIYGLYKKEHIAITDLNSIMNNTNQLGFNLKF